ncbi:hypothetical protein J6590_067947 [Homalodisca vitripennis]|nr:hypothetical protein J6590_067947 [Homalodisca vitripennis]
MEYHRHDISMAEISGGCTISRQDVCYSLNLSNLEFLDTLNDVRRRFIDSSKPEVCSAPPVL